MSTTCEYEKPLLRAAINAGKGEVNWSEAREAAADRELHQRWIEAAGQPEDAAIVEQAMRLIDEGNDCTGDEPLKARCSIVLTIAAGDLIQAEAFRLQEEAAREQAEAEAEMSKIRSDLANRISKWLGRRCKVSSDGCGGYGSIYLTYESADGSEISIRISDHAQVAGGGFSLATGERHGESDISYVIRNQDHHLPTREEVRREVADVVRSCR